MKLFPKTAQRILGIELLGEFFFSGEIHYPQITQTCGERKSNPFRRLAKVDRPLRGRC